METYTAGMTDQYCLTMSESFMRRGMTDRVTFSLFARSFSKERGYSVAMGVETAVNALLNLRFTEEEMEHISTLGYKPEFVDYLRNWRFQGDVRAVKDGTVIAPQTPIIEIDADRISATLVESLLLSIIGQQTNVATKAARVLYAAKGNPCWDFSLRRLHGPHASYGVARASYAAGFAGTATISAAAQLKIPSAGTMAHQYIMARGEENELEAFKDFLLDNPKKNTLLVDTFDTVRGTQLAIAASQETGIKLQAIRLDSGDLSQLSKQCRVLLDEAGMQDTHIMASNDLDEYKIQSLLQDKAQLDAFGIGTQLGSPPPMGVVYKLSCQHERQPRYAMKNAPGKKTDPGAHQVWRTQNGDVLGLIDEVHEGEELLSYVVRDSKRMGPEETLEQIRQRVATQVASLSEETLRLENPVQLQLKRTERLTKLRESLTTHQDPVTV